MLLALSKLGATYVPLDVRTPKARKESVLADCQAEFVISTTDVANDFVDHKDILIELDIEENLIMQQPAEPPETYQTKQTAYIIYSSGTTGIPKGVPIGPEGLAWWDEILRKDLSTREHVAVAANISHGFDAHLWEAQMAWARGGTLYIASQTTRNDVNLLISFLQKHGITDVTLIPEQGKAIADLDVVVRELKESGLQAVYFTGSASTSYLVQAFAKQGIEYHNCYGPTEATYDISKHSINFADIKPKNPPRTPLEKYLSSTFKEVLGIKGDGELDIHTSLENYNRSSLFIAFINKLSINKELCVNTSGAVLKDFELESNPLTIANLAKYIHLKRWEAFDSNKTLPTNSDKLASGDSKNKSIFLIPPITGYGYVYQSLASRLSQELNTNVYTFFARGLDNPLDIHAEAYEFAEDISRSVNKIQPDGKILILGWSFGGILAIEVAKILEEKYQRKIKFLGLIDTLSPSVYKEMDNAVFAKEVYSLVQHLCKTIDQPGLLTKLIKPDEFANYPQDEQIDLIFDMLLQNLQGQGQQYHYNLIYTAKMNMKSVLGFEKINLKVDLNLFNTSDSTAKYDPLLGWRHNKRICIPGGYNLQGDHFSIIDEQLNLGLLVESLAETLKPMVSKISPSSSGESDASEGSDGGYDPEPFLLGDLISFLKVVKGQKSSEIRMRASAPIPISARKDKNDQHLNGHSPSGSPGFPKLPPKIGSAPAFKNDSYSTSP